ncbi:MAG: DUF192 domain-containing protein [Thaumarchaeota archaeon]|nr:DUF192 domain-containing protein [Nitrososphaerota archaeon]
MPSMKTLFVCLVFTVALLSVNGYPIQKQTQNYSAFAQPSGNNAANTQSFENTLPVPDWIKNDTGLWTKGKIDDSQFMLGIRYLVANNIMYLPPQYVNSDLQRPIPSWVKDVATWWVNGNVSDYDFLSDVQYLVGSGEIKLEPDENKTAGQDSDMLLNNFPSGRIKIDNTVLDVQIADTPDRMTEGLQFQKQLSYNQGMIFVFPQPQIVAMWMKDMQFPLDMIWFDNSGNVVHIEKDLPPCSNNQPCPTYDGDRQSTRYVLEVTAGFVGKFNVTEGSKLTMSG